MRPARRSRKAKRRVRRRSRKATRGRVKPQEQEQQSRGQAWFAARLLSHHTAGECLSQFPNFKDRTVVPVDPEVQTLLERKFNDPIPECCGGEDISYFEVLKSLSGDFTKPIYIVGGAVRDFLALKSTTAMNDIDINYTIPPKEVLPALQLLGVRDMYMDKRNYVRVGPKSRDDYLEGFNINPQTYTPASMECKMNSLMFCVTPAGFYLIDLYGGEASRQAKEKIWEAPTEDYQAWLSQTQKLLWRLLKFELRGYTVPHDTKLAVYRYWVENASRIKEYYWQNMWWTLNPEWVDSVIDLMITDCEEVGVPFSKLIKELVERKLLVPNKS